MGSIEYTAMTRDAKGGTQAVTIRAYSKEQATEKLLKQGYYEVLWVM